LVFCDFLRQHPGRAAALSALKWQLAKRFNNDRRAYIDGKAPLCAEITREALLWRDAQE
jgi:GrpB-like predicted nucleotidyltransferase (UPF0157 family)